MNPIINIFKKHINFSNFFKKNGFILVALSIVVNHLVTPEHFPLNKSYSFPWESIIVSILLGSIIVLIAGLNFQHFKKKDFTKKINLQVILHFLFSTLGYISIIYIALYYSLNGLVNGTDSYNAYYLLTGLSVTLLLSSLGIAILFSNDIYQLHKFATLNGKLRVRRSGNITLVNFTDIAFIYSENKIVYIVQTNGTSIVTDFTLNEKKSNNYNSISSSNRDDIEEGILRIRKGARIANEVYSLFMSNNCTCPLVLFEFDRLVERVNKFFESQTSLQLYENARMVRSSSLNLEAELIACSSE